MTISVDPTSLRSYTKNLEKAKRIESAIQKSPQSGQLDPSLFTDYKALVQVIKTNESTLKTRIQNQEKVDTNILKAHKELTLRVQQISGKVKEAYQKSKSKPSQEQTLPELRPGETPLHWAVRNHRHDVALQLRAAGHSPRAPDAQNISPMDEAILQDDPLMTRILLWGPFLANPQARSYLDNQMRQAKSRLDSLTAFDPETLSSVYRSAFDGSVDELETETAINKPDAQGLTPLHYAIMGNNRPAVEYLAARSNLHYLTPKGKNSYLDYAIASGSLPIYNLFEGTKVAFRLARPEEQMFYLAVSGILRKQLRQEAMQKDPLRQDMLDESLTESNIQYALTPIIQWVVEKCGYPIPPQMATLFQNQMSLSNTINALQRFTRLGWMPLPKIAWTAISAYYKVHNYRFMLSFPAEWLGVQLPPVPGVLQAVDYFLPGSGDIAWKLISVAKIAGLAAATFPKIGSYWQAFQSRPSAVLQSGAIDLFNFATQTYFTWQAFNPSAPLPPIPPTA